MLQGTIALDIAPQNEAFLPSKQSCLERPRYVSRALALSLPLPLPLPTLSSLLPTGVIFCEGKKTLDCFSASHDELPSLPDTVSALRICTHEKQANSAIQVHLHVCSNGFNVLKPVCNYLVPMHVDCGNMAIAQQAFQTVGYEDNQSWTSLIFGFIDYGRIDDAFRLYQNMEDNNIHVSNSIFVVLLQTCARLGNARWGLELHMQISLKGLEEDLLVANTLLAMYTKCCLLIEARVVFDTLPERDVVSWTALIQGYGVHGMGEEALACFDRMEMEGVSPNIVTFACILKSCCSKETLGRGREIHSKLTSKGFLSYTTVGNSLITMYAKCGALSEAYKVLAVLPSRDLVSWTSIIAGYVEHGPPQEAIHCFEEMQQEGIHPDAVTFACSLKACGILGAMDKGCEIHKTALKRGFGKSTLVGNTLVGMYSKWGALAEAQIVFNELPTQDCISWTALISGYAEHGPGEKAINYYEQMLIQGVMPNTVTFVCVLKACADVHDLAKGLELHSRVTCIGLDGELVVSSSLVDMYSSCKALREAQKVFEKAVNRDVVLWTALIAGHCEHASSEEALEFFTNMQLEGISPDATAFACSLKACSNLGALDRGREIHTVLADKGLQKDALVGNALIEMYAKCGSLFEAQEAFDMLEFRDIVSWTSLIAGYVEHGFCQEALKLYEQLQKEGMSADSIILSCILNACGSLGAIQKGREIHQLIAEEEFEKDYSVGNSLLSMYARCGSVTDAQDVFDALPARDIVAWSSMMKGYCMCHEDKMALCCFEDMQKEGVNPDSVTFTCLLTACSHGSLLSKGLHFYKYMREHYDVVPTVEHHTCIIDVLARSGNLYEAEKMVVLLCPMEEAPWAALLAACKTFSDRELGLRCFQQLLTFNSDDSSWFVLMADIYTNAGSPIDARCLENLRKHAGAKKLPATARIEINKKVYEFVKGNTQSKDISNMLQTLNTRIKEEGHLPNIDNELKPVSDVEKDGLVCEHAEKLAIAFGILTTPQGSTLHVTKNLRMCNECHTSSKIISKIERREIILRDTCCIHQFRNGLCSCGDLF